MPPSSQSQGQFLGRLLGALGATLVFCSCATPGRPPNPWGKPTTPAPGAVASIGGYSAGCIRGAQELPAAGPGYQVMRPSRHRAFGHPAILAFIEKMGKTSAGKAGDLLVGDIAQPRGGPAVSGHDSHQTGLDVDIWFLRANYPLTPTERETLAASTDIGPAQWDALKRAAQSSEVERIFVNPAIKRDACKLFPKQKWLRKVRPWYGHRDHFHVRIACPADSPECKRQPPVEAGTGCDKSLDWWFSDEAAAETRKRAEAPPAPKLPDLPVACAEVLSAP